jgi:hypothetical protein
MKHKIIIKNIILVDLNINNVKLTEHINNSLKNIEYYKILSILLIKYGSIFYVCPKGSSVEM